MPETFKDLASYRRCIERIHENWPKFLEKRKEHLAQQERFGTAAEKVAENILNDLFTVVLDWSLSELNHQVERSDLLLTRLGIKSLIIEAKRPGALAWNRVRTLPEVGGESALISYPGDESLLHPKHKIPAQCFAHVRDANNAETRKLPYRTDRRHAGPEATAPGDPVHR